MTLIVFRFGNHAMNGYLGMARNAEFLEWNGMLLERTLPGTTLPKRIL